jgi:two-component system, cell cycle sensor histidine kinase and response regulator CckA
VVQGYSEMALAEDDAGPSTRGLLLELKEATARATALVRDLLVVGQRGQVATRRVEISALVQAALPSLQAAAGESIIVSFEARDGELPILGEDELILRMLNAFMARARESMPDGGRVTLRTSRSAGQGSPTPCSAVLSIADTGLPIAEDARDHLFEPYLPGRSGGKGLGLGMSIAWGAARRLGASIRLESTGPQGTAFVVELPLREQAAVEPTSPAPEAPAQSAPSRPSPATVLIAEDDESLLGLAAKVLEREGYTVLRAADGQEAVEAFEHGQGGIDLVILDDVMPRMGGRAALARIRRTAPHVPAILCSGYTWSLDGQAPEEESSYELLSKPWQPRELLRRVRERLESGR